MAPAAVEFANEAPVLNVINKRIRALRKKLNRISQMEESLSQGKTLNKEQEETFRSKTSVLAGIDELEKLRQPLLQALAQEVQTASKKNKVEEQTNPKKAENSSNVDIVSALLPLIYFGSVFDVKTLLSAHENLLTRTHERTCCLSYDYVTDDDAEGDLLKDLDLDLISELGSRLLISRPVNSTLSHKNSLEECVEHAKLWIAGSEQPIEPNSNITYAALRKKLNKIMASEYFTTTPEIKAPVDVAAAGSYTSFQIPVDGPVNHLVDMTVPVESSVADYQQEVEKSANSNGNTIYANETGPVEVLHEGKSEVDKISETQDQTKLSTEDQNSRDEDFKEHRHANRRPYQNSRGGYGGSGRRGYANGRGGPRGNRGGGHQNGRGQFYDQPGGYYPRNNHYRGRGGRGMGGNYNNAPNGHAPNGHAASHAQEAS